MGRYRCTGLHGSPTTDGKGTLSAGWTFVHDAGAMVSNPDGDYLYYGWWVRKDKHGHADGGQRFY